MSGADKILDETIPERYLNASPTVSDLKKTQAIVVKPNVKIMLRHSFQVGIVLP